MSGKKQQKLPVAHASAVWCFYGNDQKYWGATNRWVGLWVVARGGVRWLQQVRGGRASVVRTMGARAMTLPLSTREVRWIAMWHKVQRVAMALFLLSLCGFTFNCEKVKFKSKCLKIQLFDIGGDTDLGSINFDKIKVCVRNTPGCEDATFSGSVKVWADKDCDGVLDPEEHGNSDRTNFGGGKCFEDTGLSVQSGSPSCVCIEVDITGTDGSTFHKKVCWGSGGLIESDGPVQIVKDEDLTTGVRALFYKLTRDIDDDSVGVVFEPFQADSIPMKRLRLGQVLTKDTVLAQCTPQVDGTLVGVLSPGWTSGVDSLRVVAYDVFGELVFESEVEGFL